MADCSKAVEFSHELYRLCATETDGRCSGACCDTCPFKNDGKRTCPFDREVTQKDVDIVQKWSDEHPEPKPKTYADDFFKKFPAANRVGGRPAFCREQLYGTPCRVVDGNVNDISATNCILCWACWNEVMPE